MEIWRDIEGYENLYQVSNEGRVRSLNYNKTGKPQILKPGNVKGYLFVDLCKNGIKKSYRVHRLVASAFIENADNYNEVNHINEDKTDNRVENLEWCNRVYNATYSLSKPIYSVDITTNEITYYQSTRDAERATGIYNSSICSCLKGKYKSAGGRYWYYV